MISSFQQRYPSRSYLQGHKGNRSCLFSVLDTSRYTNCMPTWRFHLPRVAKSCGQTYQSVGRCHLIPINQDLKIPYAQKVTQVLHQKQVTNTILHSIRIYFVWMHKTSFGCKNYCGTDRWISALTARGLHHAVLTYSWPLLKLLEGQYLFNHLNPAYLEGTSSRLVSTQDRFKEGGWGG